MKLESEEVFRVPPVMLAALPMNGNALAFPGHHESAVQ
jgi:hypothetical protein